MKDNFILTTLRESIENLEKFHHIEILRILKKYNVNFTENRNGVFVNMIILDDNVINELTEYIKYVKAQETQLKKIEIKKKKFKDTFFNKSNE
tara:strand:+ start:298 stop:576 length:279 start_codon:yes stop_codon:yes gene_type:complete